VTLFGVVGDLSLDIVVAQSGPRREGSDVPAKIRIGPGGQAANVAVRLARQGVDAALVAPMADDAAGRLLREALLAEHVSLRALPAARTAAVIALLDAVGERTMLSDRQTLDPAGVAPLLEGLDWIHCSGYPLLDDRTGDGLAVLLGGRKPKVRLSIAGGSVPHSRSGSCPPPGRSPRFAGSPRRERHGERETRLPLHHAEALSDSSRSQRGIGSSSSPVTRSPSRSPRPTFCRVSSKSCTVSLSK